MVRCCVHTSIRGDALLMYDDVMYSGTVVHRCCFCPSVSSICIIDDCVIALQYSIQHSYTGEDLRTASGKCLGEIVRKLGDRVLNQIIPILTKGIRDANPATREVRDWSTLGQHTRCLYDYFQCFNDAHTT